MLYRQDLTPNISLIFLPSCLFFIILGYTTFPYPHRSAAWDDRVWFILVFVPENRELILFHLMDFSSIWFKGMTPIKIIFLTHSSDEFFKLLSLFSLIVHTISSDLLDPSLP